MAGPHFSAICEYDNDTWAQVYHDLGVNNTLNLATAPKSDPHNWTQYVSNPILSADGAGLIRGVAVIKDPDDGEFKLLYDTEGEICLATGATLESLTKHSSTDVPVFSGTGSSWEQFVRHPALVKVGSTYHMYYDGREGTAKSLSGAIGHATSTDLISWTRDTANNPVLSPQGVGWESSDVGHPCMVQIDGTWHMFYAGFNGVNNPYPHWIGYATTADFSTFTRFADNPILAPGTGGAWDNESVDSPAVMVQPDGTVYLYYSARQLGTVDDAIGYAVKN